jgi:uncharacterized protein with HEPN domain
VNPGPEADRILLAHMRDCLDRIVEYTNTERSRFEASRLVQDAVPQPADLGRVKPAFVK